MKRVSLTLALAATLHLFALAQIETHEVKIPPGGLPNYTLIQKDVKKSTLGLIIAQNFFVRRMGVHFNDGWFETASKQEGVIGNNFNGAERIGFAIAENSYGTSSDYYPVDGYKRCFCGGIKEYYFRDPGTFGKDDDLNILIQIDGNNSLINQHKNRLRDLLGQEYNKKLFEIEGEIDIADNFHRNFTKQADPDLYRTGIYSYLIGKKVCIYGAWVAEHDGVIDEDGIAGTGVGEGLRHGNNQEIHPADQFWYRVADTYTPKTHYFLTCAIDNSGRFNANGDYENGNPEKLWSKSPSTNLFAIPFEINKNWKEKIVYRIGEKSNLNAVAPQVDGSRHYLIYNRDTLAEVKEEMNKELVSIDFKNVGTFVLPAGDTVYRGFLVLQTTIKKPEIPLLPEGHLKLVVTATRYTSLTAKIRVYVESIERLENNSFRERGEGEFGPYTVTVPKPVPPQFNEKSVTFQLSYQNNKKAPITIPLLEKGQPANIPDYYVDLIVPVNNRFYTGIKFECNTRFNNQVYDLGKTNLSDSLQNGFSYALTTVPYETYTGNLKKKKDQNNQEEQTDNGNELVSREAQLFKIRFRTELMILAVDNKGRN